MKIGIYYFSGTGNTLSVARDIAARSGAELVPIAAVIRQPVIRPPWDVVGIVYPVYYGELPVILKRFTEKLEGLNGRYIFAVCTYGGSAGYSLKLLRQLVRSRGGSLAAVFRVHMPQNSFEKKWEKPARLYSTWQKHLPTVVKYILAGKKGDFFNHRFLWLLFLITDYVVWRLKPSYRRSFQKLSGAPPETDTDELIHLNDRSFRAGESCTGCGLCARVCPVNNIRMVENRPVWCNHCENCLACYNWCPRQAIQGGIAAPGYYYRHTGIRVVDIQQQKTGAGLTGVEQG